MTRVAVVTGGNKGIGFAIVRRLCKEFDGDVILAARNESLGHAAVEALNKENIKPKFHQLDITDTASIGRLKEHLKSTYGGLDVLVNNAGMAYKNDSPAPFSEQAEVTMKTNFTGTLNACDILFPLLRPHARVVHVSSTAGVRAFASCSDAIKERVRACKTFSDAIQLMNEFVAAAKEGKHAEKGWPNSAYGTSKLGVNIISAIQHNNFLTDGRQDIVVNACCPGYVATDMSSYKGPKTIDEGADTPCYLAMLPPNTTSPRGVFVSERVIKEWN